MALDRRPISTAVEKRISFYLEEIRKIDPTIIIERQDWCYNFKNHDKKNLFYFTFSNPLSFRIKNKSDDVTYDFMTTDGSHNKKIILDKLRALIFESYMNREGLIPHMGPELRTFILKSLELNNINKYVDANDSFTAYIGEVEIFKLTRNPDLADSFFITIPEHIFHDEKDMFKTYEFTGRDLNLFGPHLADSARFFWHYRQEEVLTEIKKIEKFLHIVYGQDIVIANKGVDYACSLNSKLLFECVLVDNNLLITLGAVREFMNKQFTVPNLVELYHLLDNELYKAGKKLIDSFDQDQILLLTKFTGAIQEYNSEIKVDYIEREIDFKLPAMEAPFAAIKRSDDLNLKMFINGRIIEFEDDKTDEILKHTYSYLISTDARIRKVKEQLQMLKEKDPVEEADLEIAHGVIDYFNSLPDMLKDKYESLKTELSDMLIDLENKIEEMKKALAAPAFSEEAYKKVLGLMTDMSNRIDALEARLKYMEDKLLPSNKGENKDE